ncbi:DapH/DapD/GlmU-related protein [Pedobacter gandavensis]|uniref:DapH/DapD/GlmU-related protein n=1 Tax=Pedobacter gandavensis TaxID=2679963 RepID=UPI00292E6989|nr:DapH/DapD/GlmU-related protein [Pedobacter gandavensis]
MKAAKKELMQEPVDRDIFDRLRSGGPIRLNDPEYFKISEVLSNTMKCSQQLNTATDLDQVRHHLAEIIGEEIDKSTTVFIPFYTNFGRFIKIGKNVFINHGCSFLDLGGITIEDGVLIGPGVKLVTESHPLDPNDRTALITKPVTIKQQAWIGAGAIILPGVTIGKNAVVAAGAVVSKDVPDNMIVAGVPARIVKSIND